MLNKPFEDTVQHNLISEGCLHNLFGKEVLVFDHSVNDKERGTPVGYREVFCRYIRLKNGKIIYPKNARVFHFFVKTTK